MQETSIIYTEQLNLNIDEELKYQKRFGVLNSKNLLKKNLKMNVSFVVLGTAVIFLIGDISIWYALILALIGAVIIGLVHKRSVKKGLISVCKINYENPLNKNKPERLTFKENGVESVSPYSKAYIPYEKIERVISDPMAFVIKNKGNDYGLIVPKPNQNAELLFNIDNILREKLNDRFIYEM